MDIRKVEPGTVVVFEGTRYIFGKTSAQAFNTWVDIVKGGFPNDWEIGEIHIYSKDGDGSIFMTHQEIAKALSQSKVL